MARYGRGLICLTLTRERCRQLRLPLMVSDTDTDQTTNFTVSIEAAEGVTTGISAHDRAHTVRTAVDARGAARGPAPARAHLPADGPAGRRADACRPYRGRLRPGAARRLDPSAVIVEILNEDGTMARRPDLEKFARDTASRSARSLT